MDSLDVRVIDHPSQPPLFWGVKYGSYYYYRYNIDAVRPDAAGFVSDRQITLEEDM